MGKWRERGIQAAHWTRALLSLVLYLSCAAIVFYAIAMQKTAFFPQVPMWANFVILVVFMFLLGIFEGSQICFLELMKQPSEVYRDAYPHAWGCVKLCLKPFNLERFLVGRQILVFLLTFFLARLTTITNTGVFPRWFEEGLLSTGLFGALLTTITAQLVPRVIALGFPVQFINNLAIKLAFRLCLWIEFTGIAYSSWLIASLISVVTGLKSKKKKKGGKAEEVLEANPKDPAEKSLWGQLEDEDANEYFSYFLDFPLSVQLDKNATDRVRSLSSTELLTIPAEPAHYPSQPQILQSLKAAGLEEDELPPFLLDPSHPNYIPDYIHACTLLAKSGKEIQLGSGEVPFLELTRDQFEGADEMTVAEALVTSLFPPAS